MKTRISHPQNVPGDFYVENGCCAQCSMPFTVAPDLFGTAEGGDFEGHCYVRKQPTDEAELHRMVQAFQVSDLSCTRYKGRNKTIQIQLVESGEGEQCDFLDFELKARAQAIEAKRIATYAKSKGRQK